ncbi:MAG: hypothetical protein WC758_01440 [Candidatus Woesearchaeota archaeon]|jgi:hypothetical protein
MNNLKSYSLGVLTGIAIIYGIGTEIATTRISENQQLEKLKQEFVRTSNSPHTTNQQFDALLNESRTLDYDGKLDAIVVAKNKFIEDNGLSTTRWETGSYGTSTPTPRAINILKWSDAINTSSIDQYFKEHPSTSITNNQKYK